jgi:hypothetical protein
MVRAVVTGGADRRNDCIHYPTRRPRIPQLSEAVTPSPLKFSSDGVQ